MTVGGPEAGRAADGEPWVGQVDREVLVDDDRIRGKVTRRQLGKSLTRRQRVEISVLGHGYFSFFFLFFFLELFFLFLNAFVARSSRYCTFSRERNARMRN